MKMLRKTMVMKLTPDFAPAQLQQNPSRYVAAVKLQKGYEETSALSSKYAIAGGGLKKQQEAKRQLMDMINTRDVQDLTEDELNLIKTYNLGLVGKIHEYVFLTKYFE